MYIEIHVDKENRKVIESGIDDSGKPERSQAVHKLSAKSDEKILIGISFRCAYSKFCNAIASDLRWGTNMHKGMFGEYPSGLLYIDGGLYPSNGKVRVTLDADFGEIEAWINAAFKRWVNKYYVTHKKCGTVYEVSRYSRCPECRSGMGRDEENQLVFMNIRGQ